MAGQVFDDLAAVGRRDLTIPPHSGKSAGSEVGAGIFLHLISLQILGSASSSADRPGLREGGTYPPCISSAQRSELLVKWFPKPVSHSPDDRSLSQQQAVREQGRPCFQGTGSCREEGSTEAGKQWLTADCSPVFTACRPIANTDFFPFCLPLGKALQTVTQNLQRLQAPGQSGQSWLEP